MTSLSSVFGGAAFSILISSSVFIFLWLFSRCIMDLVSSIVLREFWPSFYIFEIFPMFFESCVKVSVGFFLYKICCSWCMSIYKPPSCHICYTVLFYLRLCCSVYLFCRLFLYFYLFFWVFLLVLLIHCLCMWVLSICWVCLFLFSIALLLCFDFCFLINLWIVFRMNPFLIAISSMYQQTSKNTQKNR